MSRVDWKNYDYSQGPPKGRTGRCTNPYSKTANYRTRPSATSPLTVGRTVQTSIDSSTNMISPDSVNAIGMLERNVVVKNRQLKSYNTAKKLTYRPPTPIMSRYASDGTDEQTSSTSIMTQDFEKQKLSATAGEEEEEPFDSRKSNHKKAPALAPTRTVSYQAPRVETRATPPKIAQYDLTMNVPSGGDELIHLSPAKMNNFSSIWNETETEDWDERNEDVVAGIVSDIVAGADATANNAGAADANALSDNDADVHAIVGPHEVENIAGDRSTATGVSIGKASHQGSRAMSISDASLAQMEVTRNTIPISILKNSVKFDNDKNLQNTSIGTIDENDGSGQVGSRNSSPKRKHPWDKDHTEETPMDEVGNKKAIGAAMPKDDEYFEDKTDLSQYEADDQEIAQDNLQTIRKMSSLREPPVAVARLPATSSSALMRNRNVAVAAETPRNDNMTKGRKERRRRARPRNAVVQEEDDTSIEDNQGKSKNRGDTLQDRTKQAWSKRNQSTAVESVPENALLPGSEMNPKTPGPGAKRSLVSFHKDTVHEFVPDENDSLTHDSDDGATEITDYTERTDDYYYDDDTYTGRSMHSMYTKSNESEAEDFFKDIFLIGSGKATNPGRRELRHKSEYKEAYKARRAEYASSDEDMSTLGESTLESASLTLPDKKHGQRKTSSNQNGKQDDSKSLETYEEEETDAFAISYNYCDDFVRMLTNACGLTSPKPLTGKKEAAGSIEGRDGSGSGDEEDEVSLVDSFIEYATKSLFPSETVAFSSEENKKALMDLALSAAQTMHELKGTKFDDLHTLDLRKDIKIIKTTLGLPIGVVFAENATCCWVGRIFETGNAAKASIGDKLQVGDQLAAVNGITAMRKNVTEVCRILASAPDPDLVELTFVRYSGQLHPASNEQQGYEVIDAKLNKGRFSPVSLARKISFTRPRSPDAVDSTDKESRQEEVIKISKSKKVQTKVQKVDSQKSRSVSKSRSTSRTRVSKAPQENNPSVNVKETIKLPIQQESKISANSNEESPKTKEKKKKKRLGFLRWGRKKNKSKKK